MLLCQRPSLTHNMRHVDKCDERQSGIAVDHRENLVDVVERHFVSAVVPTLGAGSGFAIPRGEAGRQLIDAVIIAGDASRYGRQYSRGSRWILSKVHRGQIENHHRSAAVSNEQRGAVRANLEAVRPGHGIDAVAAGSTALCARPPAEFRICAKTRKMEWLRGSGYGGPASKTREIAEHGNDGWNHILGRYGASCGKLRTQAGSIAGVRDGVHSLNGVYSDVVGRVDYRNVQTDAVGNVVQVPIRVDPTDVEGSESTAGFAGRIVLRHGDGDDVRIAAASGGAAHGTVGHTAAAAQHYKYRCEKNSK